MPKLNQQEHYDRVTLVLARALYPTPMGEDSVKLSTKTAINHTRMAIQALKNAGFKIVKDR